LSAEQWTTSWARPGDDESAERPGESFTGSGWRFGSRFPGLIRYISPQSAPLPVRADPKWGPTTGRPPHLQETTVLKKVGFVVAGATIAALAATPFAFAGNADITSSTQNSEGGLVNIADTNVNPAINACDNQVPVNVLGVQVPLNDTSAIVDLSGAAAAGVLGDAEADAKRGDGASLSDDCVASTSTDAVNGG
jgi:hypothetical protein